MPWETRRRGRYYYKCVKLDGQPRKVYMGKGRAAEKQAEEDAEARRRRHEERQALDAEKVHIAVADAVLDRFVGMVDLVIQANLIAANFHTHRGQWRHRRAYSVIDG